MKKPRSNKINLLVEGLFAVLLLTSMSVYSASAARFSEHQIKAALLYNFSLFVTWPRYEPNKKNQIINYCVLQEGDVERSLHSLMKVDDEKLVSRQFTVLSDLTDISLCHILFINENKNELINEAITLDPGSGILVVSDQPDFINKGGMIGLVRKSTRVEVHINMEEMTAHGFKVSSKLLRLAKVHTAKRRGKTGD